MPLKKRTLRQNFLFLQYFHMKVSRHDSCGYDLKWLNEKDMSLVLCITS